MMNGGKRKIELIEYVGLFLVAFSFLMLVVNPGGIGNLFNNMFNHAAPIIIKVSISQVPSVSRSSSALPWGACWNALALPTP